MTREQAIKLIKRVPSGNYNDLLNMFKQICRKEDIAIKDIYGIELSKKGWDRYYEFFNEIIEIKYVLSYLTNNKVNYSSTHDLDCYFVN